MEYKIKTVVNDNDICELEMLAKEIWNQHFVPIIGQPQVDYMLEKFQCFASMKQQISDGMIYKMVCSEGQNIGYCGYKKSGERVFLSKLYIKLEYRGKGLSKVLLDEVRKFVSENSLNSVYLTVNKYNNNTISIYKHLGFEVIDSVVTDIGSGFVMDDYIMQTEL